MKDRTLSDYHRDNHTSTLRIARHLRRDGAAHARLMHTAKTAREYFARLRAIGS